jgi:hypothetical protein
MRANFGGIGLTRDSDHFTIQPTIGGSFRSAWRFTLAFPLGIFAYAIVANLRLGGSSDLMAHWQAILATWVALTIAIGAISWLYGRLCACSIDSEGISGRDWGGMRHRIAWTDVASTRVIQTPIPALRIEANGGLPVLYAYCAGMPWAEIRNSLERFAGPDHDLTSAVSQTTIE